MIILHRDCSVDTSLESGRCISNSIDVTSGHTADPGPMVTDHDSTNVTANPTDGPCDPTDVTGDLTDV